MIFPSGAELISPELVTKFCKTKPLLSACLDHHSDPQAKLRLSVPAEEVQLLVMGIEVLLELLRARETPIALVTRPVLFLLPEYYWKCQ